jgi:hypothetical protein
MPFFIDVFVIVKMPLVKIIIREMVDGLIALVTCT